MLVVSHAVPSEKTKHIHSQVVFRRCSSRSLIGRMMQIRHRKTTDTCQLFFLFYCQLTQEECIYTQVHIDTRTISRHLALNKHPLKHKQHSAITPDPSSLFLKRSKADKQKQAYVLNSRSHFIFFHFYGWPR